MISFIQMSLSATVLTAAALLMRRALGGRLPRRTFKLLWAVVILRMLLPISLPLMKINIGAAAPVPEGTDLIHDTVVYSYMDDEFTRAETGLADYAVGTVYEVSETDKSGVSIAAVWSIGALAVFGYFAVSHIRFRKRAGEAIPLENPEISGIAEKYSLKRKVKIKVSDRLSSPLTYGVLRPVIILPKDVLRGGGKSAEYILAHEFIHIKRFDALYKWVMTAAVCLHWFNPLAWVMLAMAGRDIELSCDEEVILAAGGAREEYAMTLIGMEERRSFGVLQSGFGGNSVAERIRAAMTVKKATPAEKAAALLLVAAAFTVFTVYDIDSGVSYAVTVAASNSAEVSYTDSTAEEGAYYSDYVIEAFADEPFAIEETDLALNFAEVLIEDAPAPPVEAEAAAAYETSEAIATKMYVITTADGTVVRDYPKDYSLYYFSYNDPETGVLTTILIDLNEYSPIDHKKYGLTVSKDKGYYLYNGVPVGGFQCLDFTTIDDIAIKDGGQFFIYKEEDDGRFDETAENGMVQVNINQFCHITGARL